MTTESPRNPAQIAQGARRTGRFGRGEGAVWLMGSALFVNVLMIATLVWLIAMHGMSTFWPRPVELVVLASGERFLGMPVEQEVYQVSSEILAQLRERVEAGEIPPGAIDASGSPLRRLYRVGNRDLGQEPFRWVPLTEIESVSRPEEVVFVEREDWGPFLGIPRALVVQTVAPAPLDAQGQPTLGAPAETTENRDGRPVRTTRRLVQKTDPDGSQQAMVVTQRFNAEGPGQTWTAIEALHPTATQQRLRIRGLQRHDIGTINGELTRWVERVAQARIELERVQRGGVQSGLPRGAWVAILACVGLLAGVAGWLPRLSARRGRSDPPASQRLAIRAALLLALALALFAWLERPRSGLAMTPERLQVIETEAAAQQAELTQRYQDLSAQIEEIRDTDARHRVVIEAPGLERFAPERQTTPDVPLRLSQIIRIFRPNQLSVSEKLGIYGSRWAEFLTDDPRGANTEGGVFPVIFGTVLLTVLLSIIVVPLGVLAALYLREYARQGFFTSIIRIAINNLAGVPSIVYGVFGLGFFCYAVGAYIDGGPAANVQLPRFQWWFVAAATLLIALVAMVLGVLGLRRPGTHDSARTKTCRIGSVLVWIVSLVLVIGLVVTTPYFHGFFEVRLPDPTFGKRGLLWASLTLALLTLPVVIVSTEEAIAAVQPSLREGSYGCGASKWQTIRRVVLPGATPGILTGMILAMARGAGEVAPLMLVGALKWAPELPVSSEAPFLHLDRSFMHLGFHIYDLGFQSPDSEAARPLVWTSTLLLLAIVLLLNLAAITLRARVRRKMGTGHF